MDMEKNGRKATQTDEGWRSKNSGGQRTAVDEGWRKRTTIMDEGWRKKATGLLKPENNKSVSNHFVTIDEFKEAVAKLSELVSSEKNVYKVKRTLSTAGGQSIVLLCSDPDGKDVAAKVYYEPINSPDSNIDTRTRVFEYMATKEGQRNTLAVSEIGVLKGTGFGRSKYYFEIMPYVKEGDITNYGAFSFEDVCVLTKQLNETLHSIHSFGILHRDISPENIFKVNGRYVLSDFGVAKSVENGQSCTKTVVGKDGYTAPELRLGFTESPTFVYTSAIDYYSLGVTLASLFEGHFVYENMNDTMIATSVLQSSLPLTKLDAHREELENLLRGLCQLDSNKRFGYEDVNRWLQNHNYTGGIAEEKWGKPFRMFKEEYRDEKSMFMGVTKDEEHWNEARKMLFSKMFEFFFREFRTDLASTAKDVEETYRQGRQDKGLAVFLKNMYAPGHIVWRGSNFSGLQDLGNRMVVAKTPAAYGEILQNRCISHWLANTEGIQVNADTKKLVDEIEALSISEPELACYWFGNAFAAQRQLTICGKTVSTISQLVDAMFASPLAFYQEDGLDKLLSRKDGADLYGFLFSLGYKAIVEEEWQHVGQCDLFNKTCLLFSMMDIIADKAHADTKLVREFFVKYGPVGIAAYTKRLIDQGESVYKPLDYAGKKIVSQIADFLEPASGTVAQLTKSYTPLMDYVDSMRRILNDNPYRIAAGDYENKGVICVNVKGCFAFDIFDRKAPFGFKSYIKGGSK